jgi:L-ascorbate metabolism protein UlaG (beta-lactamase superfamily)
MPFYRRRIANLTRITTLLIAVAFIAACGGGGDNNAPVAAPPADEFEMSRAHYLGNEAVMVEHGETKILFDPLFRDDFDEFELVPPDIEHALLAGKPPWDGIDAVFVSHSHEDHYDPAMMLSYLRMHSTVELYAPTQAVDGLREVAAASDSSLFDRVHGLPLAYGDAPIRLDMHGLLIEAVHMPHSGWPERNLDTDNISFRVTLNGITTVSHLGDADADVVHFEKTAGHWEQRRSQLAMPPYWHFRTQERRDTLIPRLHADHAIGVHVRKAIPDEPSERPIELQGVDLFTRPGETRDIPVPDSQPE